jgi:hypothetical protein
MGVSSFVPPRERPGSGFVAPFAPSLPPVNTVAEARQRPNAVLGFDPPAPTQTDRWDSAADRLRSPLNGLRRADRAPDFLGCGRHVETGDAEGLSASTTAFMMAASAPTLPASPAPRSFVTDETRQPVV